MNTSRMTAADLPYDAEVLTEQEVLAIFARLDPERQRRLAEDATDLLLEQRAEHAGPIGPVPEGLTRASRNGSVTAT